MALTLISTPGASDANSYLDIATAKTYFETRLYSEVWTNSESADQKKALVMATRLLDQYCNWLGNPITDTQALWFPAENLYDRFGNEVDYTTIPDFVENATAEYAMLLLEEDLTADSDTKGFSMLQAGSLKMEIDKHDQKTVIPESVYGFIDFAVEEIPGSGNPKTVRT